MSTPVFCETAELAAEATSTARSLGLSVSVQVTPDPLRSAVRATAQQPLAAALCVQMPEPVRAIAALHECSERARVVVGAVSDRDPHALGLALDLGFVCVRDVAPALAALALLGHGAERPFRANARRLSSTDQVRIERALGSAERGAGKLLSEPGDGVAFQRAEHGESVRLGHGLAVAQALRALAAAEPCSDPLLQLAPPGDAAATRDVLFGPPRLLSDPASKAALGAVRPTHAARRAVFEPVARVGRSGAHRLSGAHLARVARPTRLGLSRALGRWRRQRSARARRVPAAGLGRAGSRAGGARARRDRHRDHARAPR